MEITTKSKQSINLIPESEREQPLLSKVFPLIIFFLIIVILLLGYGGLVLLNAASQKSLSDTKSQVSASTLTWQKYEPVASTVKAIVSKKASYDQSVLKYSGFDTKLDSIRQDIPVGIEYTTLDVDLAGKATVSGASNDPKIIYQYYNELLAKKNYSSVNLSEVSKDSGLSYKFTMNFIISAAK